MGDTAILHEWYYKSNRTSGVSDTQKGNLSNHQVDLATYHEHVKLSLMHFYRFTARREINGRYISLKKSLGTQDSLINARKMKPIRQ